MEVLKPMHDRSAAHALMPCTTPYADDIYDVAGRHLRAVCRLANNQVDGSGVPGVILERGILYAPDYVISAGGLISVYIALHGYDRMRALSTLTSEIYGRLRSIFQVARELGIPTSAAAHRIVAERPTEAR